MLYVFLLFLNFYLYFLYFFIITFLGGGGCGGRNYILCNADMSVSSFLHWVNFKFFQRWLLLSWWFGAVLLASLGFHYCSLSHLVHSLWFLLESNFRNCTRSSKRFLSVWPQVTIPKIHSNCKVTIRSVQMNDLGVHAIPVLSSKNYLHKFILLWLFIKYWLHSKCLTCIALQGNLVQMSLSMTGKTLDTSMR